MAVPPVPLVVVAEFAVASPPFPAGPNPPASGALEAPPPPVASASELAVGLVTRMVCVPV
jgi:hypothetical protein